MSIEKVRSYFREFGREQDVLEFPVSSATVELAAKALDVIPARIAKTLSFRKDDSCILIVAAGDAKVDNGKFKREFSVKPKMLQADEVAELTGHQVGGVCPFVSKTSSIYLDVSLKRFETIFPACGSSNSAIRLSCDELFEYAQAVSWVDVCKNWQEEI